MDERETILRYDPASGVSIFTAYLPVKRKLEKAGYAPTRISTVRGEPVGWFYSILREEFHWRAGRLRTPTPAQLAARQASGRRLAGSQNRVQPLGAQQNTRVSTPKSANPPDNGGATVPAP